MAFLSNSQTADMRNPKHMPQSPCRMVMQMTQMISPSQFTSYTTSMKRSTRIVWPTITTNCVTTCDNKTSMGVTPATQDLSKSPSVRSTINADDVRATAKKKTILKWKTRIRKLFSLLLLSSTYVRITPGATKSVNDGFKDP